MIIVSLRIDSPSIGLKTIINICEKAGNNGAKEYKLTYLKVLPFSDDKLRGIKYLSKRKMNNLFKLIDDCIALPEWDSVHWEDTATYQLSFYNNYEVYNWTEPDKKVWKPLKKIADRLEKWSEEK